MKTNCKWKDVMSVYNSLPQYEKLFLGNRFIDSPHTVFRWVERHHGNITGFIEAYDKNEKDYHISDSATSIWKQDFNTPAKWHYNRKWMW